MARGKPTGRSGIVHNGRGFTYDFGIAIAASTVRQLGLLSGSALTLTSAMYALTRITGEYVDTLKKNQLFFRGQIQTANAMRFAQQKLLSGITTSSVNDVMQGMALMQEVGLNAKSNFDFVAKASKAVGIEFSKFAGIINSAINGSTDGMVQLGLMTHRAARQFEKFGANTVMRQQAIMNFLKQHKGLNEAIKNNFNTFTGQIRRVGENLKMFVQYIMGDPRDPNSLYGQVVNGIKQVADWFQKHGDTIRKVGTAIGRILGWVFRQIFQFARFVGRQVGKVLNWFNQYMDNFREKLYSTILWLELWKVHLISWVRKYKDEIKTVIKVVGALWLAHAGWKAAQAGWTALTAAASRYGNVLKTLTGGWFGIPAARAAKKAKDAQRLSYVKDIAWYNQEIAKIDKRLQGRMTNAMRKELMDRRSILLSDIAYTQGELAKLSKSPKKGIMSPLNLFKGGINKLKGAWRGLLRLLVANPKVAIVAAIVGLVGYIVKAVANWKKFRKEQKESWTILDTIVSIFIPIVGIVKVVAKHWEEIRWIWDNIKVTVYNTWEYLKYKFEPITSAISKVWEKIKNVVSSIVSSVKSFLKTFGESLFGRWISKGLNWVGNFFRGTAESTAERNKRLGIKYKEALTLEESIARHDGIPLALPPDSQKPSRETNPLLDYESDAYGASEYTDMGGTVNVNSGAVQITIQKGSDIDEIKLANMIKKILPELAREARLKEGR